MERALQQLKIRLDACDRVTHLLLLGCWFGFADVYSILYRSPTVGGKWRAPAGNEDRRVCEGAIYPPRKAIRATTGH